MTAVVRILLISIFYSMPYLMRAFLVTYLLVEKTS